MYEAKIFGVRASTVNVVAAGTLDGDIDFVFHPTGGRSRTVQITPLEARRIAKALKDAADDVEAFCLLAD